MEAVRFITAATGQLIIVVSDPVTGVTVVHRTDKTNKVFLSDRNVSSQQQVQTVIRAAAPPSHHTKRKQEKQL